MSEVENHTPRIGTSVACEALGIPRATLYRHRNAAPAVEKTRPVPARALSLEDKKQVLNVLHSERFVDKAPGEVVATLLDEERYYCSERTMYRILNPSYSRQG